MLLTNRFAIIILFSIGSFGCASLSDSDAPEQKPITVNYTTNIPHHEIDIDSVYINSQLVPGVSIQSTNTMPTLSPYRSPYVSQNSASDMDLNNLVANSKNSKSADISDPPSSISTLSNEPSYVRKVPFCSASDDCFKNEVFFDLDSFEITDQKFLATLPTLKGSVVEIIGYADRVGDPNHNMNLASQRALAVQKLLQSNGITVARIAPPNVASVNGNNFRKVIIVGL